jgi:hypothetical protein
VDHTPRAYVPSAKNQGQSQFLCHVERIETSLNVWLVGPNYELRFFSRDCGIRMTPKPSFLAAMAIC